MVEPASGPVLKTGWEARRCVLRPGPQGVQPQLAGSGSRSVGCSFQFGRTSILLPRLPHLAQTTRGRNDGTSVSAG